MEKGPRKLSLKNSTKRKRWNLITARIKRNLTQKDVGLIIGIDEKMMSNIETGYRGLSEEKKNILSKFLGESKESLFEIIEPPVSLPKMKNKYVIKGDITEIFVRSNSLGEIKTIISTCKLKKVMDFPGLWVPRKDRNTGAIYIVGSHYKGRYNTKLERLHKWITDCSDGMVVDHINHNTLDNTDSNLRVVSKAENSQNRKGCRTGSKSGIRGVTWAEKLNKWRVRLMINYKSTHIGYYDTLEEAEYAAIKARKKYMPFSQETPVN